MTGQLLTDRTKVAQDKARVLREALPWITRWSGRTIVVKYGGNVAGFGGDHDPLVDAFCADIALLRSVGLRVVVVHGGGPQITELSERLGVQAAFVDGRRVTDAATLEIVRLALLGRVNPWLVGRIAAAGTPAAGLSGTDAGLATARLVGGGALGHVGEIAAIAPAAVTRLLDDGVVPVVATLARLDDGSDCNVNADTFAGALAVALGADKLIYLSNVPGLYEHFGTDASTLLSEVTPARLQTMLDAGELSTGMIPKIESVLAALAGGVRHAHLLDGRVEHALLLEIFTDEGVGTMVSGDAAGPR